MTNKTIFSTNIDAKAVQEQYDQEQGSNTPRKTQFNEKNYLSARLRDNETTKTLVIRLLPFSSDGGSPFHKVHMHTVKVNKEVSSSGWKTFVCPIKNEKDGAKMGDACPFCETSEKARELKFNAADEATKKRYGDIEFLNRVKDMWIVRCIERGHEDDGVKFWLFNSSKKKDGVYDKIMNLAKIRSEAAARKGNVYSIFDLNNGLDLIVTLTKTSDGKTSIQIVDDGTPSPLTEDYELGMRWINDEKQWDEVYTVKPYNYMSIIAMGGVPMYDKEQGKLVDKVELEKVRAETEKERIEKEETEEKVDYSQIVKPTTPNTVIDATAITVGAIENSGQGTNTSIAINADEEEDLPF